MPLFKSKSSLISSLALLSQNSCHLSQSPSIKKALGLKSPALKQSISIALLASTLGLAGCQTMQTDRVNAIDTSNNASDNLANSGLSLDLSGRHEYMLDNGLKVVIKEDHRAPVVMTQIWYNVGSSDEPATKGGISHLLEHMMFKGTTNISGSQFERLVAKHGGVNNAFTSYDYTGYYELFPANYFELALELEADRMTNLTFDTADFEKEHQVVMEERRQRTDDNPVSKAYEEFRLLAMPDSPKGESVIGPMDELASITLPELKAWYAQWYAPNNATLVIVGDVEAKDALAKVKQYFGSIAKKPIPKRNEVTQTGFRGYQQVTTKQAVQVPMLFMAYNVPSVWSTKNNAHNTSTPYALALAQDVLDGGLSARLERRLVREQGMLASVGTSYDLLDRGDGLFLIQATPREGISLAQAQQAVLAEIERLKTDPIEDFEITRAKTNTTTSLIYSQDSVSGQAQIIGSLQSIGLDDRLLANLPSELNKISPDDIKNISKKYLVKDNLSVMYVEPK